MKQLTGKAHNIEKIIIGKITRKQEIFSSKKDLIYVSDSAEFPKGYLAVISSQIINSKDLSSYIDNVEGISELHENDVVSINEKGKISVLFDIHSIHNSLFVTERCNSNCIMCPQPPVKHEEDRTNFNLKLISLIDKNIKEIGITGGEPTLLGNRLFDIFNAIYNRMPNSTINLLSNGINFENYDFTKQFVHHIKQDIIIDIPLYSDIDSIHNGIVRSNTFFRTIQGIYNLAKFDLKIGIRVVVHKMNYDRLAQLSEFIYSNFPFVYHVAFMQMEPIGLAKAYIDELWVDPIDYNKELETAVLNLYHRDIDVSIYNAQLCILPENMRRFAVQSISEWKNIYIDECNGCIKKSECPGFFASSKNIYSRGIMAIKDLQTIIV